MSAGREPIPAAAFDGDCGVSLVVALYQRVDVRLKHDSEAFRGRVIGIYHDSENGQTFDVALDAPIKHAAMEGVCGATEQWRIQARLDEIFPVSRVDEARDAAIFELIEAARSARRALAWAVERNAVFEKDYTRLDAAIDVVRGVSAT